MKDWLTRGNSVEVFGCQWGDEGKGKVVDWLAEQRDVVIRFQGGNNAGHTLVIDGKTIKLSMLPSGIVRDSCINVLGNGVVVDPFALVSEMENMGSGGHHWDRSRLLLSDRAVMILPFHAELDKAREAKATGGKIGTTGRGIGPAYEDKVGRRAFHLGDLKNLGDLITDSRMEPLLQHHNALRLFFGLKSLGVEEVLAGLGVVAETLSPYICDVGKALHKLQVSGKQLLFEGAQGAMLDIDHGTYPYVTSSNTFSGQSRTGSGLSLAGDHYVLGVAKVYATRVGNGVMVSEIEGDLGSEMVKVGGEYGTVTGRERRCGWFDLVAMKRICEIGGVNGLALTKLDVFDHFDDIFVCEAYELEGERHDSMPSDIRVLEKMKPILRRFDGWKGSDHSAVRKSDELSPKARKYIDYIEEFLETPIKLVSVGAAREAIIVMD